MLQKDLEKEIADLQAQIRRFQKSQLGLVFEDKKEDVVAECEKKIPVLKQIKKRRIIKKDCQNNLLIEGDNYHALTVLNYTHKEKVDVIYIDPPYNTGASDWKYNNDYVDKEDAYRHSKWLSMMKHRLELARNLLTNEGFLICAIDHNELFTLGVLLDKIFGEHNRIAVVTVQHNPKGRNQAKFFSENSEFMLVYAKDITKVNFNKVVLDEEVQLTFNQLDKKGSYRLEPYMRARTAWSRQNRPKNWYPIYVSKNLKKITSKKTTNYHEIYPITNNGKEMAWKNVRETFDELNNGDYFSVKREDDKIRIYHKYREQQVLKNIWLDQKYQSEFHGTNLLKKILGGNIFDFPKSIYLVTDILKLTTKQNSIILDFFAGSGTTGHAVLELNKDGGKRSFILCTNNENKISEEVTYPRIRNVINGYSGVKGISANLSYYKTDFVDIDHLHKVSDDAKINITYQVGEMIAVRENTLNEVEKNEWWQIFEGQQRITGIYFKEDKSKLAEFITKLEKKKLPVALYIFSWGKNEYKGEYSSAYIRVEDIPDPILEVYKEINSL